MKKTTLVAVVAIALLGFLFWKTPSSKTAVQSPQFVAPSYLDYKNTSYVIGAQNVFLKNGISEVEVVPGTNAKLVTKVFGNEITGDFNGDGQEDVAFLITQTGNGSGTFYYAAVALRDESGKYKGTNAIFLGDRVAPQNILYSSGVIAVNYADRKEGEPMTADPSVGMTKFLTLDIKRLVEISIGKDERLIGGTVVIGGEVREFKPCGEKAAWIVGESAAYQMIKDMYAQVVPTSSKPYTPVFTVLVGKTVKVPKDGFGADYKSAFNASQILNMNSAWRCN